MIWVDHSSWSQYVSWVKYHHILICSHFIEFLRHSPSLAAQEPEPVNTLPSPIELNLLWAQEVVQLQLRLLSVLLGTEEHTLCPTHKLLKTCLVYTCKAIYIPLPLSFHRQTLLESPTQKPFSLDTRSPFSESFRSVSFTASNEAKSPPTFRHEFRALCHVNTSYIAQ